MEERDKSSLRVVGNPTLGVGWLHEHSIQQPPWTLYRSPKLSATTPLEKIPDTVDHNLFRYNQPNDFVCSST